MKKYKTIVIDPPWPYKNANKSSWGIMPCKTAKKDNKGKYVQGFAGKHGVNNLGYEVLTLNQIASLPVGELAQKNCHLYLWVTNNFIEQGFELVREWGFKKKSFLTWGKVKRKLPIQPSMGMGYYFRNSTEHIIFAVKGNLRLRSRSETNLLLEPRCRHSQKPIPFFEVVEKCSYRPRLEMFARQKRKGWNVWGNEVKSDIRIKI